MVVKKVLWMRWIPGQDDLEIMYEDGKQEVLVNAKVVSCEVQVPGGCEASSVRLEFVEKGSTLADVALDLFDRAVEKAKEKKG